MDRASLIFCGASLALTLVLCIAFIPAASISDEQLQRSRVAAPAYELGEVDLGDFGQVPVQDLVDYYIENPPVEAAGGEVAAKERFQGC